MTDSSLRIIAVLGLPILVILFLMSIVGKTKRIERGFNNSPSQQSGPTGSSSPNSPNAPFNPPDAPPPNSPLTGNPGPPNVPQNPQPKKVSPGITQTRAEGGIFASKDYRELREDGAILIGFDIGLGAVPDTAVVTYLRPIWLTAGGEQYGTAYGRTRNPITTVKARDGYAISGILMKSGGAIEGICFTFMRRGEKHLIADDFYVSDWYGEQTRKLPNSNQPRGDGGYVIGIYGKRYEDKGGFDFEKTGGIGTIGLYLAVKE